MDSFLNYEDVVKDWDGSDPSHNSDLLIRIRRFATLGFSRPWQSCTLSADCSCMLYSVMFYELIKFN